MRNSLRFILIILIAVSSVSAQTPSAKKSFKVVLDPGHGGRDSATKANGIFEKDVVLNIALEVKKQMQERNIQVLMTRESDVFISLGNRAAVEGDLFISLHANSVADSIGPSVRSMIKGIEVYVDGRMSNPLNLKKSKAFASLLHKELNRLDGIKPRSSVKEKPLAVLKNNQSPAILVELGFLTNPEDLSFLTAESSYKQMATAFVKAISEFITSEN